MEVARHRTALIRTELSRPLKTAIADSMIFAGTTVMDYGCGHGSDTRFLKARGFDCLGWDPVHAPGTERRASDVVNLGYVVNVIEDQNERREALREAWTLAERLLVVSARLVDESPDNDGISPYSDGVLTRIGTFQKFFEQQELRNWIDQTLDVAAVAAAPGIFYVFRNEAERSHFIAARFRRPTAMPRLRVNEQLFAAHQPLLEKLAAFVAARGRLPGRHELAEYAALEGALGSIRRAFRVLELASDPSAWAMVRETRSQDILMILALSRFDRRQRFNELPTDLQLDVKAFFGSYTTGCKLADDLLFSLGKPERMEAAFRAAGCGKLMPRALYAHVDALPHLPLLLRLYESCARTYAGTVAETTIIKLGRSEPNISYLQYPEFDIDPHPALVESISVHLQTFRIRTRSYRNYSNPFILHRKEEFLPAEHPLRPKFERLTRIEEAKGLYEDPSAIGTRDGWAETLRRKRLAFRGHRLLRT